MLVVRRKKGQEIRVGETRIKILETHAGSVVVGIEAPKHVPINRGSKKEEGSDAEERRLLPV